MHLPSNFHSRAEKGFNLRRDHIASARVSRALPRACLITMLSATAACAYAEGASAKDRVKQAGHSAGSAAQQVGHDAKAAAKEIGPMTKRSSQAVGRTAKEAVSAIKIKKGGQEIKHKVKGED